MQYARGLTWKRVTQRQLRKLPDMPLILTVTALAALGMAMIYSTTYVMGYDLYRQPLYFFYRQLITLCIGLGACLVLARLDYRIWRRFSVPAMAAALVALLLILILGGERFGAQRWVVSGSIQPSEAVKLVVILYAADWLASKGKKIVQLTYGLIPFSIAVGLVTALIMLQPDFSTALIIILTAAAMFFIAGADLVQFTLAGVFSAGALWLVLSSAAYRAERLKSFLTSFNDPFEASYQVKQALIALGSGGIWGLGPGSSRQKLGYLPTAHSDSIFAVIGEEMGLLGTLAVVLLFALLAYRGIRIALRAPDTFGLVLASGITVQLVLQAMINLASITATVPFTGVPLPLISFGGSSLVATLAGIGLLLSVSRYGVSGLAPEPE